jgi:uncharacterized protein (TIGR01244 family)
MPDFTKVTADFSVSTQLSIEDIEAAAAAGYGAIISNRPDGEEDAPAQPDMATLRVKAEALGMAFHGLPYSGAPGSDTVKDMAAILKATDKPVLAYCRTGTRAILAWALGQEQEDLDAAIAAGTNAGFDLSTLLSYM